MSEFEQGMMQMVGIESHLLHIFSVRQDQEFRTHRSHTVPESLVTVVTSNSVHFTIIPLG